MELQHGSDTAAPDVARIEEFVRARTNGMIRNLQVEYLSGRVVLTGRAPTYYVKQLATHGAMDAEDDLLLSNEVEVH